MRYHITLVRMDVIKSLQVINTREGVEKKRTLLHYWWKCNLVQLLCRRVWRFLKNLKIELSYYKAIKMNEIMSFAVIWMDLEIIILTKVNQTKTNII